MSFDPNSDWHHDEELKKRKDERRPPLFWWSWLAIAAVGILILILAVLLR
ncbi:hypothetical protein J2W42_003542 [Rhizobium tibeticum]|uniref:Uncharacterized protein n=1 Tax=Rhizobium tibeticum TaxID=501024 RepID=A0A1H8RWM7_9HYPH|nr:hypothetical protein [Rhizobium tibeticum]MDP9810679.1 hypothetical protein [Rhizobium tibeticum]SEI08186.1 hypothetical protein RTCCBAU85039_4298 [Rhizobium tibeticum]SEO70770.1 hypothetical protein SAMN05216228_1022105 [Rhizobium tibeticum]